MKFNFSFIHRQSLKTRLTLFTLLIFLIGVWVLTFYTTRMLHDDTQHLLGEQHFSTVSLVAEQINDDLEDRIRVLKQVAGEIKPDMLDHVPTLQELLNQRSFFQSLFNAGVIVVRADGTAIAELPLSAARIGVSYMDIDSIAAALKKGKSSISKPVIGKTLKTPLFNMAEPIRDEQGKVIGAVFGVINLSQPNFLDKMARTHYGKTGGFLLTDPQHKLFITGTDKSRIMQPTPARGINPMFDRCMDGFEGYDVGVSSRGVEELAAVKGIPVAGWFLAIVLPTEEAFAAVHTQQRRMLLAALLLTLLAGGMIWWMTAWMLKRQFAPMLEAAQTLDALSTSGQPPQPLPITRHDEIGELIGGFNRLLQSINQRENFLKQILDTSSAAIFLVNMQGRITLANQRMAEMFSCSVEDLQRQDYVDLLHPTERESGRQNMLALLKSKVPLVTVDRFYWRPDQTEFWGHLTGKRFFDASGDERGLIGVIIDINERKQAEEELLRSNRELEQFSYSISHDMRQPLRMISSYLQLLQMKLADQLDAEKREYFHYAIDGAKRLDAMLLGLLEYSRVGRKGEPPQWLPSRAVLDEALLFLQPAIAEAQAQIHLEGDWPPIFVSPDEMLRLMQNLIGNALKFRVAGRTPVVTITSETRGEHWHFCVTDNGIGILPDQIGRLFQVFQRLQSRAVFEGTGIGLALCRKIAEHHGGKIGVESQGEDQGCRFCVDLPRPPAAQAAP